MTVFWQILFLNVMGLGYEGWVVDAIPPPHTFSYGHARIRYIW